MKNLVKLALVFALFVGGFTFGQIFANNSNAEELLADISSQNSNKRVIKLMCTTISCCGIGSWGIEIFSDTECHYIVTSKKAGRENNNDVVIWMSRMH